MWSTYTLAWLRLQGNLTKWKQFITALNWMPVGIVDVNLPFRFTLSDVQTNNSIALVPLLAYYNENFFNSNVTPTVCFYYRLGGAFPRPCELPSVTYHACRNAGHDFITKSPLVRSEFPLAFERRPLTQLICACR